MKTFEELGLKNEFLGTLRAIGFSEPTEIQEKTIPLALTGKDIIGESATGSGKTLAFGASILQNIVPNGTIQALIMAPTRELAEQVSKSLRMFSQHRKIMISAVYGGVGIEPQIRELQRADIVVGTPGRILDHLERRTINLKNVKTLVLDEADKMLDMGFIDDVVQIIENCPTQRQTLLFSATISPDIARLAKRYMNHPAEVAAITYVDASKLTQIYYDAPKQIKFSLLVHLLKNEHGGLVMVFCNTRMNVDFVARHLQDNGVDAAAIHGGLTQSRRNSIIQHFHSKKVFVLVCTDVAARGLDIPNVSHVYNYDIPTNSKEYVHRIGRTARAGKEGKAINLVSDRDYDNFRNVLRDQSLKIENVEVPEIQVIQIKMDQRRGRFGGRGGFRGGRSGGYGRGGGSRDSRGRGFGRDSRGGSRGSSRGSFKRRQF